MPTSMLNISTLLTVNKLLTQIAENLNANAMPQHVVVLPSRGGGVYLQGPRLAVGLSLTGLFDELAEELVLELGMG